jgi:two-component sensor histidine kinase
MSSPPFGEFAYVAQGLLLQSPERGGSTAFACLMKSRLSILLVVLVVLPLALTGWLGWLFWQRGLFNWQSERQAEALQRLNTRQQELDALISSIASAMDASLAKAGGDPIALRASASHPLIRGAFLRRADGELALPDPKKPVLHSDEDRAFLARTALIWQRRYALGVRQVEEMEPPRVEERGWHGWYHEDGPHWLRWRRLPDGSHAGFEIERIAFLARLVGQLRLNELNGCVRLRSASGETLFQSSGDAGETLATLPCAEPMSHWHWEFMPGSGFVPGPSLWPYALGFTAMGALVSVAGLAMFFAYRRDVREAAQRVSFVNQVSHELKTPLTNIRLYVDLARDASPAETGSLLNVVEEETSRLSRMIHNVLTFARQEKKTLKLHPIVDDLAENVTRVVELWRPLLEKSGLTVLLEAEKPVQAVFDADAVEQILGNLLSNVEKYAAGSQVHIRVLEDGSVEVRDSGPGIAAKDAARIFEPFYRSRNDLTEGVSGTGLGLSIAKSLVLAQNGSLRLMTGGRGACFILQLPLATS